MQVSLPGHCYILAKHSKVSGFPVLLGSPSRSLDRMLCTDAQVMLLWLISFWVLGYVALPGGLELLGLEREELTARGQVRTHIQTSTVLRCNTSEENIHQTSTIRSLMVLLGLKPIIGGRSVTSANAGAYCVSRMHDESFKSH